MNSKMVQVAPSYIDFFLTRTRHLKKTPVTFSSLDILEDKHQLLQEIRTQEGRDSTRARLMEMEFEILLDNVAD